MNEVTRPEAFNRDDEGGERLEHFVAEIPVYYLNGNGEKIAKSDHKKLVNEKFKWIEKEEHNPHTTGDVPQEYKLSTLCVSDLAVVEQSADDDGAVLVSPNNPVADRAAILAALSEPYACVSDAFTITVRRKSSLKK